MNRLQGFLLASPWMSKLTAEEKLRVHSEAIVRIYPAGSFICLRNERLDYWMGVMEGVAVLACDSPEGKPTSFLVLTDGSWFGEGSLLKNEALRYEAFAKRDTQLALVPRATFMSLFENSIGFTQALVDQLNQRLGHFVGIMSADRGGTAEQRVAQSIISQINPVLYPAASENLQLSQEDIGHLSGLSRQVVNKALKTLEIEKLVRLEFRHVIVLDLQGLTDYTLNPQ